MAPIYFKSYFESICTYYESHEQVDSIPTSNQHCLYPVYPKFKTHRGPVAILNLNLINQLRDTGKASTKVTRYEMCDKLNFEWAKLKHEMQKHI